MNPRRIILLVLAAVAAGGVALLVGKFLGGGTPQATARTEPAAISETQVLVAVSDLQPGQPLSPSQVQWQSWPSRSVGQGFIVKSAGASAAALVQGTVVRAPMVAGEPITYAKIVKTDSTGFMAATLKPGMRAVAITVSVATVAGGFILPNDRVDIIATRNAGGHPSADVVVSNVRVLAIDQASDGKNQKAVSDVKTATLELAPAQAEAVAQAQAAGQLSLALRSLADSNTDDDSDQEAANTDDDGPVAVIRYGLPGHSGVTGGN